MVYRVDRNNFYAGEKEATVNTPNFVSDFLYSLVSPHIEGVVFDPCVGEGSLLKPFKKNGYKVLGVDIEHQGFKGTKECNYLALKKDDLPEPGLIIANPPFNIDKKTKEYVKEHYCGRPLLPEIWLDKAVELFGLDIPMILFTPYGFRLNQSFHSKRWRKFLDGKYPPITSIISLPKDVFSGILFHSEILVFNLPQLKGHYFCSSGDSLKVGNIIKDDIERTADSYERKDEIAFIADWFSAKTALEIEKITTVYMIKKELCLDKGKARQIKFMQTWKPHFSKKDFDKAAADIKEWEGKAKAQKLIS